MNTKEKIKLVEEWQKAHAALDIELHVVLSLFGGSPECDLAGAIHKMQAVATKHLSALIGDRGAWLDWYACENHFGAKLLYAVVDGKRMKARNVKEIVKIIEAHGALMDAEEAKLPPG